MVLFNPHSLEDKAVYTFDKSISPKVNVIARLEFELAYFQTAIQHLGYYEDSPWILKEKKPLKRSVTWEVLFLIFYSVEITDLKNKLSII